MIVLYVVGYLIIVALVIGSISYFLRRNKVPNTLAPEELFFLAVLWPLVGPVAAFIGIIRLAIIITIRIMNLAEVRADKDNEKALEKLRRKEASRQAVTNTVKDT